MRSRTWFLLSLLLFIAAFFFWRFAEERRLATRNSKAQTASPSKDSTAAARKVQDASVGSEKPASSASGKASSSTNSTNAVVLYPHRLQNTAQTLEQLVRNEKAILLRNALIDTGAERVRIPDELRAKGDPGSYVVQARGVADVTFHAALKEANAEIISYVPNNAYLVRLNGSGANALQANKRVQSVLPYEPHYKLWTTAIPGEDDLLGLALDGKALPPEKPLRVTLFPGQVESAVNALKGKARILGEDLKSSPFGPELIVASADLVHLANLPQVQEIEPFYEREKLNDLTRVRMGVSTDTITLTNLLDLTGLDVWVNVNDSTIDTNHVALAQRVLVGVGDGTDEDGHGTHVAGIIAGSGAGGPSGDLLSIGSVSGANFRGAAPGAKIFSMDIFAPALSDARMHEIAATHNFLTEELNSPLISNNSWGYGARNYNSSAASFDAAVRDALPGTNGSQPIVYVFAAGNSGGGNNNGQGGTSASVVSPATAKNVISVGAIENLRNITNEVTRPDASCITNTIAEFLGSTDSSNQVASFSSRGNVGVSQEGAFGRLKPDVVAPGTWIASTRSQQFNETNYYSPTHVDSTSSPNLVLDPFATNYFSLFVPDDPCDVGTVLSLTINAIVTTPSSPALPLLIFTDNLPAPSLTSGNLRGANGVTIDRANLPLDNILFYDIVNTNDVEVTYTLQTIMVLSNNFGDYFQVVSNLNGKLAPNYMFESGTSMAAPAISGMLALMQEFFEGHQITNSPAMMKALLINGSRSVGPEYTYERERSINRQGWGLPELPQILSTNPDPANWPVRLFDQSTNSALATGEQHDRVVTIGDTNSPLRVTLVWTDPPGNPAVGVKLVNDLDLVVTAVVTNSIDTNGVPETSTNVYFGNNFPGGDFTQPLEAGTNGLANFDAVRDSVNNVENVYINGPLAGQYTVSVVARRVNVNAVTAHTNGIVQDYALVISSGDNQSTVPMTVTTNVVAANTNSFVTVVTNGIPVLNQRVGANSPLQNLNPNNLTDGTNTQWRFYVLNNPDPGTLTNVAFGTFLPPNLSGASNTVPGSRRILEADIDLYVSSNPGLTNLNPAVLAAADKSLTRGGQELIVFTNRNDSTYYIGVKSEDQRASEFSFFAIASETPFSEEDEDGNIIVHGIPPSRVTLVTDGSADNPGAGQIPLIMTHQVKVGRVIVANRITHERFGDLIGTLASPSFQSAVLINHSFPDGLEGGTFTGIYDDSGLGLPPYFNPNEVRSVDGPGSLLDFVELENTVGMWSLSVEDNAVNATGQVEMVEMFIERALETNELADGTGFEISSTSIPGGQSRGLSFIVPENATNMIISISPKTGAIDTVVRRGRLMPTRSPYVDHGKVINSPGGNLIVGTTNTPPLRPGRHTLRLFNDGGAAVTLVGLVRFELDLALRSQQTLTGGTVPLIDDALTNSIIHVDRDARVTSTEVSVRIDHPRVSDLVLHLVSPQGTRILLAENRGGVSTNGYGFSNLQTNYFPATTSGGGSAAQTNTFGPVLTSGYINIDYQFFDQDPDRMQVYYDGRVIYDTGTAFGTNSVLIPYGPGVGTDIVVVMNPGGNANSGTAWNYTLSVLSGELVYATFSENTNITRVPIKFAIPPFATNLPADKVTFDSSYFENPTAATAYSAPATFDGWNLTSNSVEVVGDGLLAHRGTNFLDLGPSAPAITRTLPTTNGGFYNLRFAYRRGDPAVLSSANVSLNGVFTNEFVGNPNWVNHSISFVAPQNGTKLDIVGAPSPGGAGSWHNLIVNGSFESGLTGWTRNNAGVQLNPFTPTIPSTDGSNSVYIGINDVPNSVLSQTFPVKGGSSYALAFDFFVSCLQGTFGAMRVTLTTAQGTLFSQTYTNYGPNFPPFTIDSKSIPFTVPLGVTNATVSFADVSPNNGVACDPVLDNVRVLSPSSETVYVANNGNGLVRGFTVDGVDLGNITTVPAPFAQGIAIDSVGNIYVVSVTGDSIRRYSPSGVDLGIFASTGISDARAMVFDASGNLYVANAGTDNPTNSVRRFSPTGVDLGDFINTGLQNATGMAFDEAGNLYVANYSLNQVKKYAPNGTYLGIAISAGLNQPIGLAVIPQAQGGGFYVANDFASTVIRYNAAGNIVQTLTSGSLGRLHYLALDSSGNVYVSRFTGNAVRKFSPTGQDLGDVALAGLNGPAGIVVKQEKVPAMWFDTFELTEGGDPNYFLPEESLKTLIGENAKGDWKLEVWDNRAGAPLGLAQLTSWQLHLNFASTAASATTVSNGLPTVSSVSGNEIKYFVVDVPLFATQATNVLVSGGGPLNLLFNQEELPIGGPDSGDSILLSGTVNGTNVLTFNTDPELQPGRRYYLGVQNVNPLQTNSFTLTVTFDKTNNLVNVTPLANGVPVSTNLPLGQSIHYYQYDVSSNASQVVFQLLNLSGDADLVVRRSLLPTASSYDFNSANGGTNAESINVNLASVPPLTAGRYYVGVHGFFPTNGITYTVLATESGGFAPIGEFFNSPTFTAGGVALTAGTIPGESYELLMSTNLVNWTVVDTVTATGNQTTFTDPNPPETDTARFYQLRQFP